MLLAGTRSMCHELRSGSQYIGKSSIYIGTRLKYQCRLEKLYGVANLQLTRDRETRGWVRDSVRVKGTVSPKFMSVFTGDSPLFSFLCKLYYFCLFTSF